MIVCIQLNKATSGRGRGDGRTKKRRKKKKKDNIKHSIGG